MPLEAILTSYFSITSRQTHELVRLEQSLHGPEVMYINGALKIMSFCGMFKHFHSGYVFGSDN
jgi:hypothetical protein